MNSKLNLFQRVGTVLSALFLLSLLACGPNSVEKSGSPPAATNTAPVPAKARETASSGAIQWMGMEEALAAQQSDPKPIFIDVYTDWCGWCKVMDKKTFSRPEVAQYMNENFHSVKFNAEKEEPLTLNGQQFEVVNAGRRGIHTFAYALLNGQMSYPSYVILDSEMQRRAIIKGFKEAEPFLEELRGIR
ncbi:MAG: DUF255 domain-containing protein [Phaeodactylibacter sp.]|nr:DUF255 domain-containing protein [Phaeodactylibacter sp.]MCB9296514.1 DUF255 domain-containing protein [Lewinellaceae bacterium]